MDKGTFSNLLSSAVLLVGWFLPPSPIQAFVLSTGLFGFSGGITNWLAVKMLFDRIPGLIGSGVIPARFREIRQKVKDLIMEHFFDPKYLKEYVAEKQATLDISRYLKSDANDSADSGEKDSSGDSKQRRSGPFRQIIAMKWDELTAPDVLEPVIEKQIDKLTDSAIGGLLMMVGMDNIRPAVHGFVKTIVGAMREKVLRAADEISPGDLPLQLDSDAIIEDIRSEVDELLSRKLELLRARDVKKMMEDVMRKHLGWLIVWGNVFGGLMGALAYFAQRG